MNLEGHGIYNFGRGLTGLHDYEFSFTFRCAEVEEILEKIVKFWHFWPWPLGLCKSDKSHEIYNYPKNASYHCENNWPCIFSKEVKNVQLLR